MISINNTEIIYYLVSIINMEFVPFYNKLIKSDLMEKRIHYFGKYKDLPFFFNFNLENNLGKTFLILIISLLLVHYEAQLKNELHDVVLKQRRIKSNSNSGDVNITALYRKKNLEAKTELKNLEKI